MRFVADLDHVASRADQTFGHEKACRQLAILAGRSHDHGDTVALDLDFQRFLDSEVISLLGANRTAQAPHQNLSDLRGRKVHWHTMALILPAVKIGYCPKAL